MYNDNHVLIYKYNGRRILQVMYQNNVNDLIKMIIIHSNTIFPKEEPGPVYERILLDPG